MQIAGLQPTEGSIINLGFTQSVRSNSQRPYTVNIGALGTSLKRAGVRTAVIGNCDIPGENKRYLVSMMMDDRGIVPAGRIDGSFLVKDYCRPFGIRTDYNALLQSIDELWDSTEVFAVQLGDTSRAEDFRNEATDALNVQYKVKAIEESDAFIGKLINRVNWDLDRILIITPLGSQMICRKQQIDSVIMAGRGFNKNYCLQIHTKDEYHHKSGYRCNNPQHL